MRNSFSIDKNKNNENEVDVLFYYNGRDQYARPIKLTWNDEDYTLGGVQFWYTEHKKNTLVHHYQVGDESGDLTFDLSLETENLTWRLERVVNKNNSRLSNAISKNLVGAIS